MWVQSLRTRGRKQGHKPGQKGLAERHTRICTQTHVYICSCRTHTTSSHGGACPHIHMYVNLCTQAHTSHTCRLLRGKALFAEENAGRSTPTSPQFSSVQSLSRVRLFATPGTAARQASLSITSSWSLPKPTSNESVMPSSHPILCGPLLLPSVFPSIRVFSNESAPHIRWPKHWSFSFSISPSNEYSGLISFRMDWLDLLAVPGTLKSLLQHHS